MHLERGLSSLAGPLLRFVLSPPAGERNLYRRAPLNPLLPDWRAGVQAALADAAALLREAEAFDEASLSTVERIDKRLAQGFLRIQQWEYESVHFQWQSLAVHRRGGFWRDRSFSYGLCSPPNVPLQPLPACRRSASCSNRVCKTCAGHRRHGPNGHCANARAPRRFSGRGSTSSPQTSPGCWRRCAQLPTQPWRPFCADERYLAEELSQAPIPAPACGAAVLELLAEGHCLDRSADDTAYAPQDGRSGSHAGRTRPRL